jgi:hypothetical protein
MNFEFKKIFIDIEDQRVDRSKKHLLLDIIGFGILGKMGGAQGSEEILDFGITH